MTDIREACKRRITVPWPKWNDVMQVLGMTVVYPEGVFMLTTNPWNDDISKAEITEELMLSAKVELTEDAVLGLVFLLEHQYEYKRIDQADYEYYSKVLMGWMNG